MKIAARRRHVKSCGSVTLWPETWRRQAAWLPGRLVKMLESAAAKRHFSPEVWFHRAFGNPAPRPLAAGMSWGKAAICPFHDRRVKAFISTMPWKRLLAYITGSVDQELLVRNEYIVTENKVLRGQIHGRLRLTERPWP